MMDAIGIFEIKMESRKIKLSFLQVYSTRKLNVLESHVPPFAVEKSREILIVHHIKKMSPMSPWVVHLMMIFLRASTLML